MTSLNSDVQFLIAADHEILAAKIAKEEGFKYVAISSEVSPQIKFRERTTAVCTEIYLLPIVRNYVDHFISGFKVPPKRVDFMCSDGGLRHTSKFSGNTALLSGPAGGMVGVGKSCFETFKRTPVIGFDMVSLLKQSRFSTANEIARVEQVQISVALTASISNFKLRSLRGERLYRQCWRFPL